MISDAFREGGFWFRVGDYQFRLTCLCGADLQLDACPTTEGDGFTLYTCPQCAKPVAGIAADAAVVSPPGTRPSDDDGHTMCGHLFGSMVDMQLWPPAAAEPYLTIPRRPGFFTSRQLP
jgi:hypothetical protein